MAQTLGKGRGLLLTFDALGTLFNLRKPASSIYMEIGKKYYPNKPKYAFGPKKMAWRFEKKLPIVQRKHPNYGKEQGLSVKEWWIKVMWETFARKHHPLPARLTDELFDLFNTAKPYQMEEDAIQFFKDYEEKGLPYEQVRLGMITNSDPRMINVLDDFGIGRLFHPELKICSYDVDVEKPDPRIFEIAKERGIPKDTALEWRCVHVGDDLKKDCKAASRAGWESIYLRRLPELTHELDHPPGCQEVSRFDHVWKLLNNEDVNCKAERERLREYNALLEADRPKKPTPQEKQEANRIRQREMHEKKKRRMEAMKKRLEDDRRRRETDGQERSEETTELSLQESLTGKLQEQSQEKRLEGLRGEHDGNSQGHPEDEHFDKLEEDLEKTKKKHKRPKQPKHGGIYSENKAKNREA